MNQINELQLFKEVAQETSAALRSPSFNKEELSIHSLNLLLQRDSIILDVQNLIVTQAASLQQLNKVTNGAIRDKLGVVYDFAIGLGRFCAVTLPNTYQRIDNNQRDLLSKEANQANFRYQHALRRKL